MITLTVNSAILQNVYLSNQIQIWTRGSNIKNHFRNRNICISCATVKIRLVQVQR